VGSSRLLRGATKRLLPLETEPRVFETTVVVVLLLVVAVIAVVALIRWGLERWSDAHPTHPPLFFSMTADQRESLGSADPALTRDRVAEAPWPDAPHPVVAQQVVAPPVPVVAQEVVAQEVVAQPVVYPPPSVRPPAVATPPRPPDREVPVVTVFDEPPAPSETVRFVRSVDEPVQLLPGRLEVLAGDARHHEIRFIRIPGEPIQLILGREAGPSPQYVALDSSTVSRRHAHFAYIGGQWVVKNLSKTNPLVVNDDELTDGHRERPLADGDRLELGEVVLRFHAH
jgi:hypothetical protein